MDTSEPTPPDHWIRIPNKRTQPLSEDHHRETKHIKENHHWLHPTTTINRYSVLQDEEPEQPTRHNEPGKTPKPPPIYVSDVTTISPLIRLLEQTVRNQYELKAITNNQIKIQPKTSEDYRTIIKALADKKTEFHTYRPKEERNYKVVLTHLHYSTNTEDIRAELGKLGHSVTNIWNIKQARTNIPLSMFFVELKPAQNNKDIYNVEYLYQCKAKFEPLKHKRDIAQCANCQRYGHTKTIATSNHGASNVPAITLQTSATEKNDQMKFDASSVAEITQRTTKDAPSTKTFKRKYTLLSDPRLTSHPWNHTFPLRKTINPYKHNQE
jgi:hypothetical protein